MSNEDLSRPTVEVKIPQIKLTLEDLGYMRSLVQPKAVRCHISQSKLDKLRFLDLIARAKVPRDSESLEKLSKEKAAAIKEAQKLIDTGKWDKLNRISYELQNIERAMLPIEDDVLTEKGKDLLRHGEVKVKARKVGCP